MTDNKEGLTITEQEAGEAETLPVHDMAVSGYLALYRPPGYPWEVLKPRSWGHRQGDKTYAPPPLFRDKPSATQQAYEAAAKYGGGGELKLIKVDFND